MTLSQAYEVNFDGVIGPTHNYSGLSFGNVASVNHRAVVSSPQKAALQGLLKMKHLMKLGLKQALLPPQERPHLPTLRRLGFVGTDSQVIEKASKEAPEIFRACCSASSMWTANAATVAPSADTADGKAHFTVANLTTKFHRSIEYSQTSRTLKAVFNDSDSFVHHSALSPSAYFGDEGAANHTRFCTDYGKRGIQLFAYGRNGFHEQGSEPKKFPARQTIEASAAIARLHQLDPENVIYAQQNPEAIDAGVFHNDVISVGNCSVFFVHEHAFLNQKKVLDELNEKFKRVSDGRELTFVQVPASLVSVKDAVSSYLFNTQLIVPLGAPEPSGRPKMKLIAPKECQETVAVKQYLDHLVQDPSSPIGGVEFFDLHQSMHNGGGPACLRLRVVLTQKEIKKANSGVFLTDDLYLKMVDWIKKHYRDRLALEDLADPQLLQESRTALDELTQILQLGSIYPFQL